MKSLKMICTTTLLVLVLTIPGHGGEINTPGMTAEPPVFVQPAPNTEDNSGNVLQFNQHSELETSAWAAILLTLSALF